MRCRFPGCREEGIQPIYGVAIFCNAHWRDWYDSAECRRVEGIEAEFMDSERMQARARAALGDWLNRMAAEQRVALTREATEVRNGARKKMNGVD